MSSEGWPISLAISSIPMIVLSLVGFWYVISSIVQKIKGKHSSRLSLLGLLLAPGFLFLVLLFFLFALFAGTHSVVNLIFVVLNDGISALRLELQTGILSLRVASVSLMITFFRYWFNNLGLDRKQRKHVTGWVVQQNPSEGTEAEEEYEKRIANLVKDHPIIAYQDKNQFASLAVNLFFCSTSLVLWLQLFADLRVWVFDLLSWLLFFIVDDWAILLHFRREAPSAVSKLHNVRLYVAISAMIVFLFLGAHSLGTGLAWITAAFVALVGLVAIWTVAYAAKILPPSGTQWK